MTELNIAQVAALRRRCIEVQTPAEKFYDNPVRIIESTREESAKRIALASGHQVSAQEFETEMKIELNLENMETIRHRWEPDAMGYDEVELAGGPHDGRTLRTYGARSDVIHTPDKRPIWPAFRSLDDPRPTIEPRHHNRYEYAGWNTETKRWIYRHNRAVGN